MTAHILRGDARALPLADNSVDLIITSPPYFALRSYTDNGEHYSGQIGGERTPAEYIANLLACTREWMRVLKPSGSLFVNLGDKYSQRTQTRRSSHQPGMFPDRFEEFQQTWAQRAAAGHVRMPQQNVTDVATGRHIPEKSLMGLPWRYALGCIDDLGLILRAEIIWSKPNGLPESVTDRARRSHEQWFHFVQEPRYFAAVDEIREAYTVPAAELRKRIGSSALANHPSYTNRRVQDKFSDDYQGNPLGKLPGSVWTIATQPLRVPEHLNVDHFAAFPMEWPRRLILGWSPPGICTACGEGLRSLRVSEGLTPRDMIATSGTNERYNAVNRNGLDWSGSHRQWRTHSIAGYVCACTPYTDHPGAGGSTGDNYSDSVSAGKYPAKGAGWGGRSDLSARPRAGGRREYHHDQRQPAPTTPAVVLDPFGGTGTTALVASTLGRIGITIDHSADYSSLAQWRTTDPAQRARAAKRKPPPKTVPPPAGYEQAQLFE